MIDICAVRPGVRPGCKNARISGDMRFWRRRGREKWKGGEEGRRGREKRKGGKGVMQSRDNRPLGCTSCLAFLTQPVNVATWRNKGGEGGGEVVRVVVRVGRSREGGR